MALRHSTRPLASLRRGAEFRLQIGKAPLDRGLLLIDQALGLGAIGEIERRSELRRGDPDECGLESLGELARDLKARLVGLIERQADHHGRVCHGKSPKPINWREI